MPFPLRASLSNQGSFPPPALPGFCGTTSPSATLPARPAPRGVPVGGCAPPTGLPVLPPSPSSMRAAATTPARPAGAHVARFPADASLPRVIGGSALAMRVSGPARRSLALRPAWSLSRPRRPVYIEVLQAMSLLPSPAPIATGWSDSCRAGFAPAREWRLSTAHDYAAPIRPAECRSIGASPRAVAWPCEAGTGECWRVVRHSRHRHNYAPFGPGLASGESNQWRTLPKQESARARLSAGALIMPACVPECAPASSACCAP